MRLIFRSVKNFILDPNTFIALTQVKCYLISAYAGKPLIYYNQPVSICRKNKFGLFECVMVELLTPSILNEMQEFQWS